MPGALKPLDYIGGAVAGVLVSGIWIGTAFVCRKKRELKRATGPASTTYTSLHLVPGWQKAVETMKQYAHTPAAQAAYTTLVQVMDRFAGLAVLVRQKHVQPSYDLKAKTYADTAVAQLDIIVNQFGGLGRNQNLDDDYQEVKELAEGQAYNVSQEMADLVATGQL